MTHVIEALDWLIEYWPDLLEARLPMSTPRPWRTPELSPEAREERDYEARLERFERTALGLAESPAPVDINVLQTALDVLVRADDLAAELGEWSIEPSPLPPELGELDARPWFRYTRAVLINEHVDLGEPGPWHDHATPIVHGMYEQVAQALAMLYTGQVVRVICPWCDGRTITQPAGGAYTWKIHELPGGQIAIVCHGLCEPPEREVGTWWRGIPCWPISDWERLAKRVRANEAHETIGI